MIYTNYYDFDFEDQLGVGWPRCEIDVHDSYRLFWVPVNVVVILGTSNL